MRVAPIHVKNLRSGSVLYAQSRTTKTAFKRSSHRWRRPTPFQLISCVFNWCMWGFLTFIMLSQLLTAVQSSTTSTSVALYGQEPSNGLSSIAGDNDEPYSDRLVVCVRRAHTFKAVSLATALNFGTTVIEDSTGSAIHGYRVINRTGHTLLEDAQRAWTRTCRLMNATLNGIYKACEALGCTNLTRNSLYIVNGLKSTTL